MLEMSRLTDLFKLPLKAVCFIFVASSAFVAMPENWLASIGLAKLRTEHGTWVALAAFLSGCWLVVLGAEAVVLANRRARANVSREKAVIESLYDTTQAERRVLASRFDISIQGSLMEG
jgi:hypothetical protein